jgi:hypothetical protein
VFRAARFEIARQAEALDRGERISQETRGWVEERGVTVTQRTKEEAHDYRYFPEPDLPPLFVERAWLDELRAPARSCPMRVPRATCKRSAWAPTTPSNCHRRRLVRAVRGRRSGWRRRQESRQLDPERRRPVARQIT